MVDETGPVDILVNNAGIGVRAGPPAFVVKSFVESTARRLGPAHPAEPRRGPARDARLPASRCSSSGWGRILTIVSDAGRRGERKQAVYGAAKAAAMGFSAGSPPRSAATA